MVYAMFVCLYLAGGADYCQPSGGPLFRSRAECESGLANYSRFNGPTGHGGNRREFVCLGRPSEVWR